MKGLSCPRKGFGKSHGWGRSHCFCIGGCELHFLPNRGITVRAEDAFCQSCAWADPSSLFFGVPLQKSRRVRAECARTVGGARR